MDLFRGLIIQSGNDASVAIAEHVAGSEQAFVGLMNSWAKRFGMNSSHFAEPTRFGSWRSLHHAIRHCGIRPSVNS